MPIDLHLRLGLGLLKEIGLGLGLFLSRFEELVEVRLVTG